MAKKKRVFSKRIKRKAIGFAAVAAVNYAFDKWEDPVVRQKVRKLRREIKEKINYKKA